MRRVWVQRDVAPGQKWPTVRRYCENIGNIYFLTTAPAVHCPRVSSAFTGTLSWCGGLKARARAGRKAVSERMIYTA